MNTLQLELPPELRTEIDFLKSEMKDLRENFQPKEPTKYITRNYVAKEMLHCDLSTVHNLCKRKILTKHQIGGRVLFIREEVEKAIVELK